MFLLVVLWVLKNRPLYCYKRRVNVWFRGTTLVDLLRNNKSTSIRLTHKLRKRLLNVHLFVIRSALQSDILLLGFHSVPARWRKYSNLLSSSLTLFYSVVVWNHNIRFEKNCQQKNYHWIFIWLLFSVKRSNRAIPFSFFDPIYASSTICCTRPTWSPSTSMTLMPWGWLGLFVSKRFTCPLVSLPVRWSFFKTISTNAPILMFFLSFPSTISSFLSKLFA